MLNVYPDYYKKFRCIASKCRHNCCIGWEIDIDSDTLGFYNSLCNEFGEKIKSNIDFSGQPHFVLSDNERCPFLNKDNLCEIICNIGEQNICDICREHPRFHNELFERTESGLGLCCEEVSRIILSNKEKVRLIYEGEETQTNGVFILRDEVISILQNREKELNFRFLEIYNKLSIDEWDFDINYWVDCLLSLERLDDEWTSVLNYIKENFLKTDYKGFKDYISSRQTEYEQLAVYIIYRHFVNAFDMEDIKCIIKFADLVCRLIFTYGAIRYSMSGKYTFEEQTEIVRMFSSEIEYSDENIDIIFGKLLLI